MRRSTILKEMQSVDTSKCSDGLSFRESFVNAKKLTPIEELLYFCNCEKYYYNYSEGRLRILDVNIDNIIHFSDDKDIIFVCRDLEDDDVINISSYDFSGKIICYEDSHKVVTYDEKTKHYECFFVNISDKKIKEFYDDVRKKLPKEISDKMFNPSALDEEKDKPSAYDELSDAFKAICEYLYASDGEISEIKFYNVPDGVQVDLVTSKLWKPDNLAGA